MPVEIHLFDIYRSANIGIFLRANDNFCLVPRGLAETKSEKIAQLLKVKTPSVAVAGSRLLGPLVAMNNKGMVVSRLTDDEEVRHLRQMTGLTVHRLESRFTSIGNLISANDNGAVISDVFGEESARDIESALNVPVRRMRIGGFVQVGTVLAATNCGAVIHPSATEREIIEVQSALKVEPEPATINGGIPYVGSGFVGNSSSVLVGARTRGAELVILSRAFG
ncbi:MAG: translation initiation factor IF-6 [Nitrososphaerota archaeon]|nr:translation initiation factor IF-6 [Nitrososphaerota archaeon]